MNKNERKKIRETILIREKLRKLGRLERLFRNPLRTLPFYVLAAVSHLRPYRLSFKTLWGDKMQSYLPEGNTFYYYGYCEANLTNFFLQYIQPGMTCVDIGAHVGFYTMLFASLTGPEGRVLSFEPTPRTYLLLEKNTKELPGVLTFKKAVSSTDKEIILADYGPGYGAYNSAHSAGAADLHKESHYLKVRAVAMDEQLRILKLRPDIVKIDAEGFEHEVLLGMARIMSLEVTRPIISIEVAGGEVWAESRNQALNFLEEKKYKLFSISLEGLLFSHRIQKDYGYDNLIAIPEEKLTDMSEYICDNS